jgi:hypothetical protein
LRNATSCRKPSSPSQPASQHLIQMRRAMNDNKPSSFCSSHTSRSRNLQTKSIFFVSKRINRVHVDEEDFVEQKAQARRRQRDQTRNSKAKCRKKRLAVASPVVGSRGENRCKLVEKKAKQKAEFENRETRAEGRNVATRHRLWKLN